MIIQRDLMQSIVPFLKRKEFLAIIGPRQAGKSTFLQMLKDHLVIEERMPKETTVIITFEDRKLLMEFEDDPIAFVRSFIAERPGAFLYLMIDEFQYAEDGGQKLKLIFDTVANVKIIITGSSSLEIKAKVGKFMVGRLLTFHLYPFNFRECLLARNKRLEGIYSQRSVGIADYLLEGKNPKIQRGRDAFAVEIISEYEQFCVWGGYPAAVLAKYDTERKKILSALYSNYILKDIKTLLALTTEKALFLLSQHLAAQVGSIISYQNLGQVCGLDYRNLKKHLVILQETFICREVCPFFRNRQKELVKNPKIYFLDMGFRNHLTENMGKLVARSDAGAMVENTAFVRLNEIGEENAHIHFWRTKVGAEVDFIWQVGETVIPIEIKYSSFSTEKISRGFLSFVDTFKPSRALILNKDYWGTVRRGSTNILFAPIYYL